MPINFFENGLCFYCDLAKRQLLDYSDFHERTEFLWKQQESVLEQEIDEILKQHLEADREEIIESHGWELHLNQSKYPDIHRTALVIAVYISLEEQLYGLCHTLSGSLDNRIRLDDLRGQGIERALLYLSKVASFDLGKLPSLEFVRRVNGLRNKMVHAGGVLPTDPQDKLNKFVSTTPGLRGEPGTVVRIDSEFVKHLIEKLIQFFDELGGQVLHFMNRAQQTITVDRREDAPPAER